MIPVETAFNTAGFLDDANRVAPYSGAAACAATFRGHMFTDKHIHDSLNAQRFIGIAKMTMLSAALASGIACSSFSAHAANPSQALSRGTSNSVQLSLVGSALVVAGTVASLSVAGKFVVTALKPVGETFVLVLKSVGEGVSQVVEISVRLTAGALAAAGVVVGSAVQFVAGAAGWAVRAGSETIGYVVNDIGRDLLRQEKF